MRLNLHVLTEDAERAFEKAGHLIAFKGVSLGKPHEFTCAHPVLYVPGMPLTSGFVYVANARDLPGEPSVSGSLDLMCVGIPCDVYLRGAHRVAYTDDETNLTELFSQVVNIFASYDLWEKRVEEAIKNLSPIRRVGEISQPIIGNPIYLQGPRFENVFYILGRITESSNVIPETFSEYKKSVAYFREDCLPVEESCRWMSDPELVDAARQNSPVLVEGSNSDYPCRSAIIGIDLGGSGVARLVIDEVNHVLTNRDLALAAILGDFLRSSMISQDTSSLGAQLGCGGVFLSLVQGESVAKDRLAAALARLGWRSEGSLLCLVVELSNARHFEGGAGAISIQCANLFPDGYGFAFEDNLVFVFNMKAAESDAATVTKRVLELFNKADPYIGCSQTFGDVTLLDSYYKQALRTLRIGRRKQGEERIFHYENCILADYIDRCRKDIDVAASLPEGLVRLAERDAAEGEGNVPFLEAYLENNMNTKRTAEELFMHRNTCLNQVKKICEIGGFDLTDPDTVLTLRIALKLMSASKPV